MDSVIEEKIDFPKYVGEPRLSPPYGLVVLPSSWIDTCADVWMETIRDNHAISVNLAHLSARLRREGALPKHLAALDNPHRLLKKGMIGKDLKRFEDYYHNGEVVIWGGYDYWCRKYRIKQCKRIAPQGDHLPLWCGRWDFQDPNDAYVANVAGQYTSFAACNVLAHLLDWECTIFVLGHMAKGRYCELEMPVKRQSWEPQTDKDNKKVMAGDNHQWSYLYQRALESKTEIVHVEPTNINTLPVISEARALQVLNGN